MSEFIASNGVRIDSYVGMDTKEYLVGRFGENPITGTSLTHATASPEGIDALREFFRDEEDRRLGRWRHGEFLVYPDWRDGDAPRRVFTIWEKNGRRDIVVEVDEPNTVYGVAARAFFDAHPEPKPWHDAKPGEVWALTVDGTEDVWKRGGVAFIPLYLANVNPSTNKLPNSADITSGRRIWPEVAS